jgi:hypothetical protein
MTTLSRIAFMLVFAAYGNLTAPRQTTAPVHEQTFFREDEPFQKTVSLPSNVLRALLQTKEVKEALSSAPPQRKEKPNQFLRAAEVWLSSPDEVDYVVMGRFPFSGADNSWFWVISYARKTPSILLWTGGNSLEILNNRTNGYRDIRSRWSSASATETSDYHFNGVKYRLWEKTEARNH